MLNTLSSDAFPSHNCYFLPAIKHANFGRAMGGLSVYVKNNMLNSIKRIYDECEIGIILKIDKSLLKLNNDLIVMFIYLPPAGSPFYTGRTLRSIQLLVTIGYNGRSKCPYRRAY